MIFLTTISNILVTSYVRVCFLQARSYKLVSDAGIIRPEVFYKALTVWIDRDVLGYAFSQVCNKATYPLENSVFFMTITESHAI